MEYEAFFWGHSGDEQDFETFSDEQNFDQRFIHRNMKVLLR